MSVESEDPRIEPVYDDSGVDRSLVRWMLSLTPTQRLEVVQRSINLLATCWRPFDVYPSGGAEIRNP